MDELWFDGDEDTSFIGRVSRDIDCGSRLRQANADTVTQLRRGALQGSRI